MSYFGTISRGVKAPIIKEGDNIVDIVVDSVSKAIDNSNVQLQDRDIIGITEAVVARAQGNYASLDQISKDVKTKMGEGTVGLIFPILSRNRFSMLLKGISMGVEKLVIQLSYPSDEVGNPIVPKELIDKANINPSKDIIDEKMFYSLFGNVTHPFTGIDYIKLYKEFSNNKAEIILCNDPTAILKYTKKVINADIHTREKTKKLLKENGAEIALSLNDFLKTPVDGSGYNSEYGLYGSNLATDKLVKLFPRDCQPIVDKIQDLMYKKYKKKIEVLIYGDGAFKDPVGGIWELADPVVSPAYTPGLDGKPNEIKLKYIADNELANFKGDEAIEKMKDLIANKKEDLGTDNSTLGTTPRRLIDLLGSLCDLTSGSGDKGTPIILIQNYFDNFAS